MNMLIMLIWIISFTIVFTDLFNKKFEICLPISMILAILIVYVFGFFTKLYVGIVFTWILILTYFTYKTFKSLKNKKNEFPIHNIVTPGLVIMIILYLLICLYNLRSGYQGWDDYLHWGPMIKQMMESNEFYSLNTNLNFAHKDYPPLISLFEYIWCYMSGGYVEAYALRAIQFLSFSFLIPLCCTFNFKSKLNSTISSLLILASIISIGLLVPEISLYFYTSLYVDPILAISFAVGLYCSLTFDFNNIRNTLYLAIILILVSMSKQIGIAFSGLIVLGFIVNHLFINKSSSIQTFTKQLVLLLIIPAVFYASWSIYISMIDVQGKLVGQFTTNKLVISKIISIINGTYGEQYQIEAAKNFISALSTKTILYQYPIELPYIHSILLVLVLMSFTLFSSKNRKVNISVLLIYILGAIGYAFGMLLLYVFAFGPVEGPTIASFARYMGTYVFAGFVLLFYLILNCKIDKHYLLNCLAVLLVTITVSETKTFTRLNPKLEYTSLGQSLGVDTLCQKISSKVPLDKNVLIVDQTYWNFNESMFTYFLMPIEAKTYSVGTPRNEFDDWTTNFEKEDFLSILKTYDYIYLYVADGYAYHYLDELISEDIRTNDSLYKVESESNNMILTKIY